MNVTTTHASRFKRVRADHRTEIAEDYVELILEELKRDGRAQLTELAAMLGVAHPTVVKALRNLEKRKLVRVHAYHGVTLTKKGHGLAQRCKKRHELLVEFLVLLGVTEATAEQDAEGMEHHLSNKTRSVIAAKVKLWSKKVKLGSKKNRP